MKIEGAPWATVSNLIALLVLVAVFVLALIGQMDAKMALLLGALAVAELLD